jgi:hypothetical protein
MPPRAEIIVPPIRLGPVNGDDDGLVASAFRALRMHPYSSERKFNSHGFEKD